MKYNLNNIDFKFINNKNIINIKNKKGLILFYSNYCDKCNKIKELWDYFNERFRNQFYCLIINCDNLLKENDICCMNNNINYYPTIKYFSKSGKIYNYKGLINREELFSFICSKL